MKYLCGYEDLDTGEKRLKMVFDVPEKYDPHRCHFGVTCFYIEKLILLKQHKNIKIHYMGKQDSKFKQLYLKILKHIFYHS
jgi:hypothetical protein